MISQKIILFAGFLHFTQIPSMLVMKKVKDFNGEFEKLDSLTKRMCLSTLGSFSLTVFLTGFIVILMSKDLIVTKENNLGVVFFGFLAVFFSYRAFAQIFIYSPYWPRTYLGRLLHYSLSAILLMLTFLYTTFFLQNIYGR